MVVTGMVVGSLIVVRDVMASVGEKLVRGADMVVPGMVVGSLMVVRDVTVAVVENLVRTVDTVVSMVRGTFFYMERAVGPVQIVGVGAMAVCLLAAKTAIVVPTATLAAKTAIVVPTATKSAVVAAMATPAGPVVLICGVTVSGGILFFTFLRRHHESYKFLK